MNEIEALIEIANAIKVLAGAVGSLSTVLWLMLLFKDMNGNSGSENIANAIRSFKK